MDYSPISISRRWHSFWKSIDFNAVKSVSFSFYLVCWYAVYYFLLYSLDHNSGWIGIWIVFLGVIWYIVNRKILNAVHPPAEVILGLIFIIYSITFLFINLNYNHLISTALNPGLESRLPGFFTFFMLGLLTILFGLLLVLNNTALVATPARYNNHNGDSSRTDIYYKQAVIFWYALIGLLGHQLIFFENVVYLYAFEFFLLLLLINKTGWLEKLSRYELYLYFVIFLVIFLFIQDPAPFQKVKLLEVRYKMTWFSFPLYLHLLIKLYFLALLIKIPIVVIYNHASLARKLSMAGLLQSTFPQFFQFLFLICIFFFFISGWQADRLRESLQDEINQIRRGDIATAYNYFMVNIRPDDQSLLCSGYAPFMLQQPFGSEGVIILHKALTAIPEEERKEDYFFYIKGGDSLNTTLYLVKIDTNLINYWSGKLNVLAGNGLICYPYAPKDWQEFLYKHNLLESESSFRIYPFSFLSRNSSWSITSRIESQPEDEAIIVSGHENHFGSQKFIIGRLFLPVLNDTEGQSPYFAFDIYLAFTITFWSSTLVKIILILLLLFIVINFFIIGRVTKFGDQINKIIIQRFQQLKSGIKEISSGNLDYKFKMEGEDEFVELARHFNQMGDRLKETINAAREKDRLDQELQSARQVQLSLLPEKLPEIPGFQISAAIQTANEVGGDFYDVLQLDDHQYLFTIGDVSGKGSSAAFYMAQIISLLRFSRQFVIEPREIVFRLNQYFATQIKDRQIFITAIVGMLDTEKNTLQFVRAGHPLPVFIPGNLRKEVKELRCTGLGIGLTNSRKKYEESIQTVTVPLDAADMLLFYTDGVIEAARPSSEQVGSGVEVFGERRLMDILKRVRGAKAQELLLTLIKELKIFYKDHPWVDDHTILVIQKS